MASPIGWWMFLVKLDRTDKLLKSQTSGRRFCSAGFFVLLCIVFFTITLHLRQAALHRVALRYLNSQFLWTLFVVSVVTRAIWLWNSERLFFWVGYSSTEWIRQRNEKQRAGRTATICVWRINPSRREEENCQEILRLRFGLECHARALIPDS